MLLKSKRILSPEFSSFAKLISDKNSNNENQQFLFANIKVSLLSSSPGSYWCRDSYSIIAFA